MGLDFQMFGLSRALADSRLRWRLQGRHDAREGRVFQNAFGQVQNITLCKTGLSTLSLFRRRKGKRMLN